MHYCTYELRPSEETRPQWAAFVHDAARLSRALKDARRKGHDMGRVIIDEGGRSVEVNGGYEENGMDDDCMTAEPLDLDMLDMTTQLFETEFGSSQSRQKVDAVGRRCMVCDTNHMNYDTAVVATLFLLRHHFQKQDRVTISSDVRTMEELQDAVFIYSSVFNPKDANKLAKDMLGV